MRLRFALWMAVALAGSMSCSNKVTTPVVLSAEDIRFEVTASPANGSPIEPVVIHIQTGNLGGTTVLLPRTCPEPLYRVYDAAGVELPLGDPTNPEACLADAYLAPFEPGEGWEASSPFDGWYYSAAGVRLEAPPGTYKATARFMYWRQADSPELVTITREVSFTWR